MVSSRNLEQYSDLRWFCLAPHRPQCQPPLSDGQSSRSLGFIFLDAKLHLIDLSKVSDFIVWLYQALQAYLNLV